MDLFVASFRILKTHQADPKSQLCYQQCQIFIRNKLPVLLSMISASSFNSIPTEQNITEAWNQVLPHLTTQELLTVGLQCLHTCSLHHLITHQVCSQLIGSEELSSSMSKGLYTKDDLIIQVTSNHSKGPKLVEELVRSDGSAGSIGQAIVEVCSALEDQASMF